MIKSAKCGNCGKDLMTPTNGEYKQHECGLPELHMSHKEECNCKETSCIKDCTKNHTHKGFFCNKCEPEASAKMYSTPPKQEKSIPGVEWVRDLRTMLIENDDCNTHMNNIHEPIKRDIYLDGIELEAFISNLLSSTLERYKSSLARKLKEKGVIENPHEDLFSQWDLGYSEGLKYSISLITETK